MNNKPIYVLEEVFEGTEGLRESTIIKASFDRDKLLPLMKTLIKEDDYGLIAKNGIEQDTEFNFTSRYDDGFIEYNIYSVDCI